jgi:hypothetical protein
MESTGDTMTSLSCLLGRNRAYIQQFLVRGSPEHLSYKDMVILGDHFGLPHDFLDNHKHVRLVRLRIAANAVQVAIARCQDADAAMMVDILEERVRQIEQILAQHIAGHS